MSRGHIQQIGTPREVYNNPKNVFVAGFVGAPATNFINGKIEGENFVWGDYKIEIPKSKMQYLSAYDKKEVIMGIRPENIHKTENNAPSSFVFDVEVSELLGHESILHGVVEGQRLTAKVGADESVPSHSRVSFRLDTDKMYFFDKETQERIDSV